MESTTESRHPCPYCAEDIAAGATRCPHCRSRLNLLDASVWHRGHPEGVLGGVAAAVAHATAVPVTLVRVGFVVLTFFHLLGPLVYGAAWVLLPVAPGQPSWLEEACGRAHEALRRLRGADGADPPRSVPRTPPA